MKKKATTTTTFKRHLKTPSSHPRRRPTDCTPELFGSRQMSVTNSAAPRSELQRRRSEEAGRGRGGRRRGKEGGGGWPTEMREGKEGGRETESAEGRSERLTGERGGELDGARKDTEGAGEANTAAGGEEGREWGSVACTKWIKEEGEEGRKMRSLSSGSEMKRTMRSSSSEMAS